MEHINLLGAEKVEMAGRNMQGAADQIDRAAMSIAESAAMLAMSMDRLSDCIAKVMAVVERDLDSQGGR